MGKLQELEAFFPYQASRHPAVVLPTLPPELIRRHHAAVELLKETGFQKIKIKPNDSSRELIREWDPSKSENAGDYVVSAYIEAVKPM
jgi:hypothetical protein